MRYARQALSQLSPSHRHFIFLYSCISPPWRLWLIHATTHCSDPEPSPKILYSDASETELQGSPFCPHSTPSTSWQYSPCGGRCQPSKAGTQFFLIQHSREHDTEQLRYNSVWTALCKMPLNDWTKESMLVLCLDFKSRSEKKKKPIGQTPSSLFLI